MRTLALTLSLVVGLSLLGASSSAQVDDSIPKKPLFDLKGYNQCPSNFQPPDQPQELRCASGKAILESVRVKKYDRVAIFEGDCVESQNGSNVASQAYPLTLPPGKAFTCWQEIQNLAGNVVGIKVYSHQVRSKK